MRNTWLATATEMALIVILSAAIGLIWNRNLLNSAWHGEVTSKAKAQTQAPPQLAAEVEAMPIALAQVKELFDQKQAARIRGVSHEGDDSKASGAMHPSTGSAKTV